MQDDLYPLRLIPQNNYKSLVCEPFVEEGYIVRCLKKKAEFDPGGTLLETVFTFPQTDHWINHFSVSLLGNYKLQDAAWQYSLLKEMPRYNEFDKDWAEWQKGLKPTKEEAVIPEQWGFFWIPLSKIHNQTFKVGNDEYRCLAIHKPTKRNYWHFELHFFDAQGKDVCDLYESKQITKGGVRAIVTGIRAKLLTVSKADELNLSNWPSSSYKKGLLRRMYEFAKSLLKN